jgi:hypothetical protein
MAPGSLTLGSRRTPYRPLQSAEPPFDTRFAGAGAGKIQQQPGCSNIRNIVNWRGKGRNLIQAFTSLISRRGPVFRGKSMADISEFSIVTYERKPGRWRAAITRKDGGMGVGVDKVRSVVTPDDYASESEAQLAAQKFIKLA